MKALLIIFTMLYINLGIVSEKTFQKLVWSATRFWGGKPYFLPFLNFDNEYLKNYTSDLKFWGFLIMCIYFRKQNCEKIISERGFSD